MNEQSGLKSTLRWVGQSGAAIIAISAVSLAIWEGFENRRHNRLSVIPKVDAARDFDMLAQTFSFGFISAGLGPAVVQNLCFYVDGEKFYDNQSDVQYAWSGAYTLFRGRKFDIYDASYRRGQYLIPGNRYLLLSGELREGAERSEDFREQANRINAVVRYCSVYGDQCETEQLGVTAVDVMTCP
jgi:hypothetical protein